MRHLFRKTLLVLCALVMCTTVANAAKVSEFAEPQHLINNTGALSITRVEFTDTATVLSFHAKHKPNIRICIPSTTYLLGEQDKRYAVLGGEGIAIAEPFYLSASGEADFKVLFEPMPKRTRYFDFIGSEGGGNGKIMGIHDKSRPIKVKQSKETFHWTADLSGEFFTADTVHLCGRIKDYTPEVGFKTIMFNFTEPTADEETPYAIPINTDGTFSLRFPALFPMQAGVSVESASYDKYYSLYCVPGQCTEVVLSLDGSVEYLQQPGGAFACNNALLHGFEDCIDGFFPSYYQQSSAGKLLTEMVEDARPRLDVALQAVDYLAWRFDYSPWEHHLAETYARLRFGGRLLDYTQMLGRFLFPNADTNGVNALAIKKELNAPESYVFMRQMPYNDPASLVFSDIDRILNRYEFSTVLSGGKLNKTDSNTQSASDGYNLMTTADKQIFGEDTPSLYLEIALVRDFASDIRLNFWRTKEDWKTVYEATRSYLTHPVIRAQLDRLYERILRVQDLIQPLPHTREAQAFRQILDKYRGKYVMVDFWGMSCAPCRAGIQASLEMRKALRNHPDIEFVFISGTGESSPEAYKEYVGKYLDGEEVYEVSRDEFSQFMSLFKFLGIPHYESFDRNGNRLTTGLQYTNTAENFIKSYLEPIKAELEK